MRVWCELLMFPYGLERPKLLRTHLYLWAHGVIAGVHPIAYVVKACSGSRVCRYTAPKHAAERGKFADLPGSRRSLGRPERGVSGTLLDIRQDWVLHVLTSVYTASLALVASDEQPRS